MGERAVDAGGVAREMYSAFFKEAYRHRFYSGTLLYPAVHPGMDISLLSTVGTIISHVYMVSAILPIRIAFPFLVWCLLGATTIVSSSILVTAFIVSLCPHESSVVKKAIEEAKQQLPTFSTNTLPALLSLLSRFNSRQVLTPQMFKYSIKQVAMHEFLIKPSAALDVMNSGVLQYISRSGRKWEWLNYFQCTLHRVPPPALSSKC